MEFGLKKAGDESFREFERSGVGQGEFTGFYSLNEDVPYGSINISVNLLDTTNKILQTVKWL